MGYFSNSKSGWRNITSAAFIIGSRSIYIKWLTARQFSMWSREYTTPFYGLLLRILARHYQSKIMESHMKLQVAGSMYGMQASDRCCECNRVIWVPIISIRIIVCRYFLVLDVSVELILAHCFVNSAMIIMCLVFCFNSRAI